MTNETRVKLSVTQLIEIFAPIAFAIIVNYVALNVKLEKYQAATEVRIQNLESGRIQNANNIETFRRETNASLKDLNEKMDEMLKLIYNERDGNKAHEKN